MKIVLFGLDLDQYFSDRNMCFLLFVTFTFCLSCRTDILIWWKSSQVAEQVPAFIMLSDFSKRCTAGSWEKICHRSYLTMFYQKMPKIVLVFNTYLLNNSTNLTKCRQMYFYEKNLLTYYSMLSNMLFNIVLKLS